MEEPKGDIEPDTAEGLSTTSFGRCYNEVHRCLDNQQGTTNRKVTALIEKGEFAFAEDRPCVFRDPLGHEEFADRGCLSEPPSERFADSLSDPDIESLILNH